MEAPELPADPDRSESHAAATKRGVAWSSVGRAAIQVVQFGSGLVLARLLSPTEFGVMASLGVVSSFAILLFEMGLSSVLVAKRQPTEADFATVFWVNAISGVLFFALLSAIGPLIGSFFHQPVISSLAPIVGLAFLVNLGVCQQAVLTRALRFKEIAVIETIAAVLNFGTVIVLAVLGVGVYSLAIGPVVGSAATSALLWWLVPWRPRHFISLSSWRSIWKYSGPLLGFNVVNYWSRNADNLMIGRVLGAGSLGFYNRGYNLMLLPVTQLAQVLGRVMFPVFTAMRDEPGRAGSAYRRVVRILNLVSVPILAGMAAVAPGLVPFLWGHQWLPTVPILIVLCLAGIPQSLATTVGWIYQSHEATGRQFWTGTTFAVFNVAAMAIGLHWGAVGVGTGLLISSWIGLLPVLDYATRLIGVRATRVLLDTLPTWVVGAVMFVCVRELPRVLGASAENGAVLALQVALGGCLYVGGVALLQRSALTEFWLAVRPRSSASGADA
ncbi:lipopolysaccharide biosynthesis protein [Nocardioides mangrovicus]|nr:lipopolysaccharide biosynthesis protein [Nocardioides mangrovicus]